MTSNGSDMSGSQPRRLVLSADAGGPGTAAGLPLTVTGRSLSIGRTEGNDLVLAASHISSRHAAIHFTAGQYMLVDLGSTNGTVIQRGTEQLILGAPGCPETALQHGDLLLLGDLDKPIRLRVALEQAPALAGWQHTVVAARTHPEVMQLLDAQPAGVDAGLRCLLRLTEALSSATDSEVILNETARAALEAVPDAVEALIVQAAPAGQLAVRARAMRGQGISPLPEARACARILQGQEAALLFGQHDASELPAATLVGQGLGSGIAAALGRGEARFGVLQVNCAPGQLQLSVAHLDLTLMLAHQAALALERAELVDRLQAAEAQLREENTLLRRRTQSAPEMVACSPAMQGALKELQRAASADVTVLLQGETGTGKEVAARFLHAQSRRSGGLLVTVNCGALSETLLDSELFGHRKGAFTGATSDRKGVFEVAAGGTVFLDEIGETPPSLQVRLLRVLEEGKIKPVGETLERKVDVRVVAATNRDLAAMVERGEFRRDLYYRLKVFPITLPPLRERPADIEPLCRLFIGRFAAQLGKRVGALTPELLEVLRGYSFPGNVRELANELERALVRADEAEPLLPELLSEDLTRRPALDSSRSPAATSLAERLAFHEREIIAETLTRHRQQKTAAAKELGLTRQGLAKKMARLGLP